MESTIEKNKNIKNINRIGKIMKVLLRICQVFMVIGFIAVAAGMAVVMAVPIDDIRIRPELHIDVDYNTKDFDSSNSDLKLNNKKFDMDVEGFAVDIYTKTHKIDNKMSTLSVEGKSEEITGSEIRLFAMKKLIIAELFIAAAFVALTFGAKLAKALQKCDTPFSDEIVKKLVSFGKSLIPLGICSLLIGASGIDMAAVILVLFLFISLFKYGAHLQKSVDGMA